jgi:hypothetical protein
MNEIKCLYKRRAESWLSFHYVKRRGEVSYLQPGRGPSPEPSHPNILISDFQSPER